MCIGLFPRTSKDAARTSVYSAIDVDCKSAVVVAVEVVLHSSPAYVMHLDYKALVLHAHPDRTIWPLWADALALLGIRP